MSSSRPFSSRLFAALAALLLSLTVGSGDRLEANPSPGKIIVVDAGTVITVTGEEYSPGMIVIEDGEITLVGQNLDVPSSARRISARAETVMPGMVLAQTRLGLGRINRAGIHCDARALDEIHADELDGEPFLEAGIVAVAYSPSGTGFPGQAAVIRPPRDGEATVLREAAYLPVVMQRNGRDRGVIEQALTRARKEIEKAEKAKKDWDKKQEEAKKKAEAEAKKSPEKPQKKGKSASADDGDKDAEKKEPPKFEPPKIPPPLRALVSILREEEGALPLLFLISNAGNLLQLAEAISDHEELSAERHRNVSFTPSSRNEQRPMVELLGEQGAVVITAPVITNLPYTFDRVNLPAEIDRAGATLVFLPPGDSREEFMRLRARTADLMRAGLSRKAGLAALTENPARFLGISDRCGAIEKGRSADLMFLDGDPFAAGTRVTRTMIAGEWAWKEEGR